MTKNLISNEFYLHAKTIYIREKTPRLTVNWLNYSFYLFQPSQFTEPLFYMNNIKMKHIVPERSQFISTTTTSAGTKTHTRRKLRICLYDKNSTSASYSLNC